MRQAGAARQFKGFLGSAGADDPEALAEETVVAGEEEFDLGDGVLVQALRGDFREVDGANPRKTLEAAGTTSSTQGSP